MFSKLRKGTKRMREDVALIKKELNNGDDAGVLICTYEVFRRFYQLQRRRAKRDGTIGFIVLISLEIKEQRDKEEVVKYVECLLKECFREEDVACRYSESQYLMIFPNCQGNIERMLKNRVEKKIENSEKWKEKIRLQYSTNRMTE